MPAKHPPPRTGLCPAERALRSRLHQFLATGGIIRGTLLQRHRRCGNPRCHCAKGPGHPGLYLVLSQGSGQRQLYIPRAYHERVRQWVANHHQVKQLIHEISELHWQRIQTRQD